ncbi:MAG: hypothetical protein ACLVEX_08830 [Ruthenibacterium lactatiformans]
MKTTIIPDRTSCGNLEYLKNHLSEIQPIKKITCYQNSENFIFSEYAILTDGVFMAIESWKRESFTLYGIKLWLPWNGASRNRSLSETSQNSTLKNRIDI